MTELLALLERLESEYRRAVLSESAEETRLYQELELVRRELESQRVSAVNRDIAMDIVQPPPRAQIEKEITEGLRCGWCEHKFGEDEVRTTGMGPVAICEECLDEYDGAQW